MLVPDEIRKCVAFIGYQWISGPKLAGTVFFVFMEIPGIPLHFAYGITAKHVIDAVNKNSSDGKAFIRFNTKDGATAVVQTECSDWVNHPTNRGVDVAALPMTLGGILDHLYYPVAGFATDDVVSQQQIGVGDDVFLTGLFVNHYGRDRNVPIVRVGNIAAMPEDRVATRDFGNIEAYLVEARSIGGLSGSPVFVMMGIQRRGGNIVAGSPQFFLLGLMHGHFDLPQPAVDTVVEDTTGTGNVNVGIGIVVPARQILEVLNHPALVAQRDKAVADWLAAQAATPDAASQP